MSRPNPKAGKHMFDYTDVMDLLYNEDISGWFKNNTGGKRLQLLQKTFADFCGTKYAYAVSSGSAAIYVALKAVGVKTGDLVAVPSYTHIGTVAPITLAGGWPVFVDVDRYGNMSPEALEHAVKLYPKISVVIVVHQLGIPVDRDAIIDSLKTSRGGIRFLIEDASHALGSSYYKRRCGSLGHIGCFSIGGGRTKIIGTGEGGMITTDDEIFAEKIRNIRNHGDRNADVPYHCFNFRMSELNAAVGLAQIGSLADLLTWQMMGGVYILKRLPKYLKPNVPMKPEISPNMYLLGCTWDPLEADMGRDVFLQKMQEQGYDGGVPRKNISGGYSKLVSDIAYYNRRKIVAGTLLQSESLIRNSVWIDWHRFPRNNEDADRLLANIRSVVGK